MDSLFDFQAALDNGTLDFDFAAWDRTEDSADSSALL